MTSEPVLHLPVRYGWSDAVRYFRRARWSRLFGLLGRPRPPTDTKGALPRMELIWMPWYAVEFSTESRQARGRVCVALDAWSGIVVIFDRKTALEESALMDPVFPSPLGEEEVIQLSRQGLLQAIMRRRGQLNKPVIQECEWLSLFYCPLWAWYHRRRFRGIDVQLMDAYTGTDAGSRIRAGVLNALVAERKARNTAAEQS